MEALSARIRNALRNLSLFSNFLLHYHFALSFFIHRNPAIPTITATLHYPSPPAPPQFKIHRQRRSPQLFIIHFSSFILTHHRQPHHRRQPRTIPRPALSKIEIRAIGATTILHSSLFIFHHSFSLIAANPTITATLHYPSPRTIKNRNSRHRRNHNSSFFIIHFSSFILTHRRQPHHRRQPRTTPRPALPPFFIFHLSKHHPLPSLRPSYQLLSLTF